MSNDARFSPEGSRRRRFLLSACALGLPLPAMQSGEDLKLGVATYSLRKFSRPQAISMLQQLGVRYLSVKEVHLPYADPPEALAAGRKEFDAAGLVVSTAGVVVTYREPDSALERYFEYARTCRIPMLIMMPTARQMPTIERLVERYDIRVAVHNHGPEDKNFPTPESAYAVVRNADPRIGLCIDIGHTARTGTDPVRSIETCADRLLDVHIKDLRTTTSHSDCEVGRGVLPVVAVLKLLRKMRFQGNIALEYETEPENPLPGMRASLAYMHGMLAGLQA